MAQKNEIIFITAYDWGVNNEQVEASYKMSPVIGCIAGFFVEEDDEQIVIAFQVFVDGGMRNLLSIPKVCVIERYDLAKVRNE